MTSFILFTLREDEKQAEAEFRKAYPDINLKTFAENLSEDNMQEITSDYDGVIVSQVQPISDKVLEHIAAQNIKVFATRSAGYDMYNKEKLKNLGIRLTNVPSYSPESIAEYAFTAGMYFSRNFHKIRQKVEQQDFRWQPAIMSTHIAEKTVGIVGTGRIGRETAKFFKQMGATVIGYDLYPNQELTKGLLDYVEFDELLAQADIISIHMPATDDNYHMFNDATFDKVKSGMILINTARGSIVDTEALLRALDTGKVTGAVLDTYEFESAYVPKNNEGKTIEDEVLCKLIAREDILWSPHIAFYTSAAVKALFDGAVLAANDIVTKGESKFEVKL